MISFKWTLSLEQPANETDLSELQKCLVTAGVFLDLSWNGEAPQLTISISEKLLVKTVDHLHEVEPSDIVDGDSIAQPEDDVVKQKGRPKSVPKNDITGILSWKRHRERGAFRKCSLSSLHFSPMILWELHQVL